MKINEITVNMVGTEQSELYKSIVRKQMERYREELGEEEFEAKKELCARIAHENALDHIQVNMRQDVIVKNDKPDDPEDPYYN